MDKDFSNLPMRDSAPIVGTQFPAQQDRSELIAGLKTMGHSTIDPSLPFSVAADTWLTIHSADIRPRTIRSYRVNLKPLKEFFGDRPLSEFHIGHVRAYQLERGKKAGHYLLNNECCCLAMILDEAGLWADIKPKYRPKPIPKRGSGHSLTVAEEQRLRDAAFQHPRWQLAANCLIMMLSTTMNWGEISHLRRRDLNMHKPEVMIRETKNPGRDRNVPLNAAARDAAEWLIERWEKLGGTSEDQYLLPHRPRVLKGPWLFDEPMTSINTAFRRIRKLAGLPRFRIHDCRVQAITKLLKNPKVSRQTAKEIAGHITQEMQDRYSIQTFDTKSEALECLESAEQPKIQAVEIRKKPVQAEQSVKSQADLAQEFADFLRWKQNSA